MRKILCLVCVAVFFAACGKTPPPPPPPTAIVMEIDAAGDINPNAEGHPAPLVLRIYEMKSLTDFKSADFITLYEKDKSVLGGDLVRKQEVILQPNDKKTLNFVASDDTQAIGVIGVFRQYEQSQWRASVPVRAHQTTAIRVHAAKNGLKVE